MVIRGLTALPLVACSKETGPTGDDDDATGACADDADCEDGLAICDAGACVDGDRDNQLEDAGPLFQGALDVQIVGQGAASGPDSWYRCAVYVEP